ncbi:hypothetical protein [uncultured Croceitalea sp.]|uniref:hypothetical protein n=1 Tax=uncultured Croceitalea sp. TaxID=1798908 RepID=UPI0033067E14
MHTINIDENILGSSFIDLFQGSQYIKLSMSDYKEDGLSPYDYCSSETMIGQYSFLDFDVEKVAVKINQDKQLKEVMLKLKVWDGQHFYEKVTEKYGMPDTSSLSKYYIEKHGFEIPTTIKIDSVNNYYNNLPKPRIKDFPEVRSLSWYDVNNKSGKVLADLVIKNKSNPSNKFQKQEIWVVFRRAKK